MFEGSYSRLTYIIFYIIYLDPHEGVKNNNSENNHLGVQVRRDIHIRLWNQHRHKRVVYGSCQDKIGEGGTLSKEGCSNCQWMMISTTISTQLPPLS